MVVNLVHICNELKHKWLDVLLKGFSLLSDLKWEDPFLIPIDSL